MIGMRRRRSLEEENKMTWELRRPHINVHKITIELDDDYPWVLLVVVSVMIWRAEEHPWKENMIIII